MEVVDGRPGVNPVRVALACGQRGQNFVLRRASFFPARIRIRLPLFERVQNPRRKVRLLAHVLSQDPSAGDQVASAAIAQLLPLALRPVIALQNVSSEASGNRVCLANNEGLARHVASNPKIGRLSVFVVSVIYQDPGDVADPASSVAQTQNKIVVTTVQKLRVPIISKAIVNSPLNEQRLTCRSLAPN